LDDGRCREATPLMRHEGRARAVETAAPGTPTQSSGQIKMKASKPSQIIDVTPVRKETLSAAEFLRVSTDRPHLIARSRFVAPVLGDKGFGSFEVQYTVPIFKRSPA
jgi:hypothetical protein